MFHKLDKNNIPVPCSQKEMDQSLFPHTIASDMVGNVHVSTVFLCINHGWFGPPLWFETMVFGGPYDMYQQRYETYEEAINGHKATLKRIVL